MDYIIEDEEVIDSNGNTVKRMRLVPCPPTILYPETMQKITDEIQKMLDAEERRVSIFNGEYPCVIQDGRTDIPWDINIREEKFTWMMVKNGHEMKIIFMFSGGRTSIKKQSIWRQGSCEFSEKGDWILPKIVMCFFGGKKCVWVGREKYAELMTEQEYKKTQKGFRAAGASFYGKRI